MIERDVSEPNEQDLITSLMNCENIIESFYQAVIQHYQVINPDAEIFDKLGITGDNLKAFVEEANNYMAQLRDTRGAFDYYVFDTIKQQSPRTRTEEIAHTLNQKTSDYHTSATIRERRKKNYPALTTLMRTVGTGENVYARQANKIESTGFDLSVGEKAGYQQIFDTAECKKTAPEALHKTFDTYFSTHRFPAHIIVVDDKPKNLIAVREALQSRCTRSDLDRQEACNNLTLICSLQDQKTRAKYEDSQQHKTNTEKSSSNPRHDEHISYINSFNQVEDHLASAKTQNTLLLCDIDRTLINISTLTEHMLQHLLALAVRHMSAEKKYAFTQNL